MVCLRKMSTCRQWNPDLSDTQVTKRIPPSNDSIILVVWIAPNGSSNKQKYIIILLTSSWSDIVISWHIRSSDAWHYFHNTVFKKPTIPPHCHEHVPQSIMPCRISSPMLIPPIIWYPLKSPNINSIRPIVPSRHKQRHHVWNPRKIYIFPPMNFGKSYCITGLRLRDIIEAHKL